MKKLLLLSALFACWLGLAAAAPSGGGDRAEPAPTDYFGVRLEPGEYSRIITLAPNLTEMLHFLGAFDRVIGVTSYDDYPPETASRERIGGYIDPDVEKIVALRPDLVLAYRGNPLPVIHKLKELGVPVFVLDNPQTLAEIGEQMAKLGRLLMVGEEHRRRVQGFRRALDEAFVRGATLPRHPRVMMLACSFQPPFYAAGRGTFIHDLIRVAGGENAFRADGFGIVTPEEFLAADPEFLLIPEPPEKGFRERLLAALNAQPCLAQTTALTQRQVIFIDENVLSRPGPRILEALRLLQDALLAAGREGGAGD